jgi:ATP-dependent Clp protease ATP-binding subunit ClpX
MGFGAKVVSSEKKKISDYLALVRSEDLLHFGLIPELMGRLPVIATMNELNEDDLVRILREPKNALTKQYERLFEFDNIRLRFTEGALRAIAQEALKRQAGARGLRSVMETAMLDVMYELPSEPDARECVISEQVIINGDYPVVLFENTKKKKSA